jgi:hypothetical protein
MNDPKQYRCVPTSYHTHVLFNVNSLFNCTFLYSYSFFALLQYLYHQGWRTIVTRISDGTGDHAFNLYKHLVSLGNQAINFGMRHFRYYFVPIQTTENCGYPDKHSHKKPKVISCFRYAYHQFFPSVKYKMSILRSRLTNEMGAVYIAPKTRTTRTRN